MARPDSPATLRRLAATLVLLNLFVAGTCIHLLLEERAKGLRDAGTQALNLARLIERTASAKLDNAAIALDIATARLQAQLLAGRIDETKFWEVVDASETGAPDLSRIGVFDTEGHQVCGNPSRRCRHIDISDRDYYRRLRDDPNQHRGLYGPYASRSDGKPSFVIARVLRDGSGGFAGLTVAIVQLDILRRSLAAIDLGAHGTASYRGERLEPVVRTPEIAEDEIAGNGKGADTLRSAVAVDPAEGTYRDRSAADQVDRVLAYRALPRYPLYAVVGVSIEDLLVGWRRQAALAAVFLVLIAASSFATWSASERALRRAAEAQRLYDEAPCGYHSLDASGNYTMINQTELQWLGCSQDELIGRLSPAAFLDDEGRSAFARNFDRLARDGSVKNVEVSLFGRDGVIRRVAVSATAIYGSGGEYVSCNAVLHDISPLHAARTQMQALHNLQEAMLNTDLVGIARISTHRQMLWSNRGFQRIFGYAEDEWHALTKRDLYPDRESYERFGAQAYPIMSAGGVYRGQQRMRRKNGDHIWVEVSGSRLAPNVDEVIFIFSDVTEQRAAERLRLRAAELEAQNTQLREVARIKDEFAAHMSHELRTPLNAVLGFAQLLQSGSQEPRQQRGYVEQIILNGEHLLQLIDGVLDYAKVAGGRMAFASQRVDLREELAMVASMLHSTCAARNVSLDLSVDPGLEQVITDPLRLRQIMLNLLSNAIRHSREGGQIEVRALALAGGRWSLEITDHGEGIAHEDLERIFEPFVQLSSGRTKKHAGTGLGLALVRQLAEALGGSVKVRSVVGLGATFVVELPMAPASRA